MLDIDYVEGLELTGKANIGKAEQVDCKLFVRSKSFPQLKIVNSIHRLDLADYFRNPPAIIKFTSLWHSFTLYNNEFSGEGFSPQYIVEGAESEIVAGVEISLSGLYTFFDGRSNFEVKESYIGKSINDRFVNTQFNIDDDLYYFSVEHNYSFRKNIDTTTLIEDAYVKIWKPTGKLYLEEIEKIIKKTRILFSLLLGFDLSIKKTWLINSEGVRSNSFYFRAASKSGQPFEQPHECFIYSADLLTEEAWVKILNSTFNDNMSNSITEFWVRLVSMFSYKGFWEYEILGVVSLLDAYSNSHHKLKNEKKISAHAFKKLKRQMKEILTTYKGSLPLNDKYSTACEVIDNIIRQVGYVKNTNAQDFKLKLKFLINNISTNIQNLLDFKSDDFEMIIKIRNSAAHGSPIEESIMQNIQRAMIVKEKIKFLLLYLFFKEMGFTDNSFVQLCERTFNKIKLGARLDEFTLSVVFGNGIALNVTPKNLVEAKNSTRMNIPIIYHVKSDSFETNNTHLNEVVESIYTENRGRYVDVVTFIYSMYRYEGYFSVEHLPHVFLCSNDERIEIHGVFLVKLND